MDIQLGTNTLRNTNGAFLAHGQEHLRIEFGNDEPALVLTMSVFMPTGTEVATLKRNVWETNPGDRFVLTTTPDMLKVEDSTLKTTVMEIHRTENRAVNIPAAKFYTCKGTVSEVSAEWWRVGNKMELTGIDADLEGGGIELPE
ncbi:MAG: hypothetical protein AB7P17_09730 [Nitrospirales bacterium]|nr:hypothetical protein [Nitrospirales bacterium]